MNRVDDINRGMADMKAFESVEIPSLQGKVAIITGSSRGIGRAIAGALAAEGAQVRHHPPLRREHGRVHAPPRRRAQHVVGDEPLEETEHVLTGEAEEGAVGEGGVFAGDGSAFAVDYDVVAASGPWLSVVGGAYLCRGDCCE